MNATATDGMVFTEPKLIALWDDTQDNITGYDILGRNSEQWQTYDVKDWVLEVRLTPRIPPLPAGTRALVNDAVWSKHSNGKWFAVAGFGLLAPFMTDKQIREKGKPLIACEWAP